MRKTNLEVALATQETESRGQPQPQPQPVATAPVQKLRPTTILRGPALLLLLFGTVATFSVLRPQTFMTYQNAQSILTLAAPLCVVAVGLTVVLAMGDFDLSVGSMIGLGGATAVVAQSELHLTWPLAVALTMLVAAAVGLVNGALVAWAGLSSFIVTLGAGTMLTGLEYSLTHQKTVYEGLDPAYSAIGRSSFLGTNLQVWIAILVTLLLWAALRYTEAGRYVYAVGDNPITARLAGIRVSALRVGGFVLSAITAASAGILLTSQANSSFPNSGGPFLLPAFAAVFLGSTMRSTGTFNIVGTAIGVLLLGVVQTGLTMLQLSTAAVLLVQGGVLVLAVLASRIGKSA